MYTLEKGLDKEEAHAYNDEAGSGEMAEWFMALVLKTSDTERYRGFESLSLRSPAMEKYPSGRRGSPAKGVVRVTAARVQIPASPLKPLRTNVLKVFFCLPKPKVAFCCD